MFFKKFFSVILPLMLVSELASANTCPKWLPLPMTDGLHTIIPIYDESITEPDMDCDEILDSVDTDIDGDGISNTVENANGTDPLNPDSDGDGVSDSNDAFPLDASEMTDTDGDGVGNNTDTDDDNDGILDVDDPNPLDDKVIAFHGVRYDIVTSPYTGYEWIDRNLGASQACTSFDDALCYGDYYQWGRAADGHEDSNSAETTTVSPTIAVGHGDFIRGSHDWTSVSLSVLRSYRWSKRDGSSVCPVGFRVPTAVEVRAELLDAGSEEIQNRDDAFDSFLKLPSAGKRNYINGSMKNVNSQGVIWLTKTLGSGSTSPYLNFDLGVGVSSGFNAYGRSIRCVRPVVTTDEPPVVTLRSASNIIMTQFGDYPNIGADAVDDVDGVLYVFTTGSIHTDVPGTYTMTYFATDSVGQESSTSVTVTVEPYSITHNGITYGGVKSPYTGKIWLDRNLGASRVCTSFNDAQCYGDYYQWGRNTDGHEESGSATTALKATDIFDAGVDFITSSSDWASADSSGSLRQANWLKTDASFVCPLGFKVPNGPELQAETIDRDVTNSATAFSNFLKLPSAGYRGKSSGIIESVGSTGYLWVISFSGSNSGFIAFTSDNAYSIEYDSRAYGQSVRCLKD